MRRGDLELKEEFENRRDSIIIADYIIGFRDMKSAVSDRCAVYRNTPGGYDIFNILSRTDSRIGKVFVESHESPF